MGFVEFAGPQDFSGVDVSAVVDPFIVDVVIRFVADDDEVFTGLVRKVILYRGSTGVSLAGPGERVALMTCCIGDCLDYEQEDGGAGEPAAELVRRDIYGAKVTNGLHQEGDNYAGEWRGIVCE